MNSFKSFACLPVSSRTPIASCMTIIATITLMANGNEPSPYKIPAEVATAQTVAEWPLGMPPSPKMRVRSSVWCMSA